MLKITPLMNWLIINDGVWLWQENRTAPQRQDPFKVIVMAGIPVAPCLNRDAGPRVPHNATAEEAALSTASLSRFAEEDGGPAQRGVSGGTIKRWTGGVRRSGHIW